MRKVVCMDCIVSSLWTFGGLEFKLIISNSLTRSVNVTVIGCGRGDLEPYKDASYNMLQLISHMRT